MARKPREDPETFRERIEQVAIRLFAERGPDAVSLAHIGKELGTSAQAVHYHYGSKAALQEATARRLARSIVEGLRELVTDRPQWTVSDLTRTAMDFVYSRPIYVRATVMELLRADSMLFVFMQQEVAGWFEGTTGLLDQAKAAGIIRADVDSKVFTPCATALVLTLLNIPPRTGPLVPDTEEALMLERRLREAFRMILTSLLVDPAPHLT